MISIARGDVVLRDMADKDVEDYVRWHTSDTAWAAYDAPWEPVESDEDSERCNWRRVLERVKQLPGDTRRRKFEIQWRGRHVGWVCCYNIDKNYDWLEEEKDGQTVHLTVGIDICESDVWGGGVGTCALGAYMDYLFENGADEIYTQTWSGNVRMLRCAEKLGFVLCSRKADAREVGGHRYDALTFKKQSRHNASKETQKE